MRATFPEKLSRLRDELRAVNQRESLVWLIGVGVFGCGLAARLSAIEIIEHERTFSQTLVIITLFYLAGGVGGYVGGHLLWLVSKDRRDGRHDGAA